METPEFEPKELSVAEIEGLLNVRLSTDLPLAEFKERCQQTFFGPFFVTSGFDIYIGTATHSATMFANSIDRTDLTVDGYLGVAPQANKCELLYHEPSKFRSSFLEVFPAKISDSSTSREDRAAYEAKYREAVQNTIKSFLERNGILSGDATYESRVGFARR